MNLCLISAEVNGLWMHNNKAPSNKIAACNSSGFLSVLLSLIVAKRHFIDSLVHSNMCHFLNKDKN